MFVNGQNLETRRANTQMTHIQAQNYKNHGSYVS